MKEEALSWTLKIMHIFSKVSGQFYMHSANYKERKGNGRTTHQKDGGGGGVRNNFVCQDPWNAAVW